MITLSAPFELELNSVVDGRLWCKWRKVDLVTRCICRYHPEASNATETGRFSSTGYCHNQ